MKWDDGTKRWVVEPAGFGFSYRTLEFVAMGQGIDPPLFVHELGHYLHLDHTHSGATELTPEERAKFPDWEKDAAQRECRRKMLRQDRGATYAASSMTWGSLRTKA